MVSVSAVPSSVSRAAPLRRFLLSPLGQATVVAAIVLIAYLAVVLTGWPNRDAAKILDTVTFPALGFIYVPLAVVAAARARGRTRAAWVAMAIGFASWAAGEIITAVVKLAGHELPFPSWADAAYLLYVPWVLVALLLFPSAGNLRSQGRMTLDGVIVASSFFLISWVAEMRDVLRSGTERGLDLAVAVAYPLGDILVVTVAFLVLVRAPAQLRVMWSLLLGGLVCAALADSAWAYQVDSEGREIGSVPDILYLVNALLIILALVEGCRVVSVPAPAVTTGPSLLSLWLPLLPLSVAAVTVALTPTTVVTETPVIAAGSLLIAATLLRQFLESAELVSREQQVRNLADRLNGELDSASQYVESILPGQLDGPVQVCSRYLPARAVGGDSFGYRWIDDDHLIVYLVDVSGHGVRPALLSVSVHNLLRSGSLANEVLLQPDAVLSDLNDRFSMDGQDGHYFTMWFGVYQLSTGVLRYANAGHPPPLLLTARDGAVASEALEEASMPVGMFPEADFASESYPVPPGSRLLLYSDGTLGDAPDMDEFVALCTQLSAQGPGWLDALIGRLPVAPDGRIEDDCALVEVSFPGANAEAGAMSAESAAHPR